jgi:hypothetical protein
MQQYFIIVILLKFYAQQQRTSNERAINSRYHFALKLSYAKLVLCYGNVV